MSKGKISTTNPFWIAPLVISMIILCAAGSTFAAIAQDGTATSSSSTSSTISWSHTTGTGSNRLLVVGVSYDARNSNTVSSVRLGSTNLTKLRSEGTGAANARTEIWYLKAPASGTNTITVSIGGSSTSQRNMAGAVSYTGVDQTTPFSSNNGAAGGSGSPTVIVTSATGNLVFDIFCTYRPSSTPSVGSGQTQYWKNTTSGSSGVNGGMSREAGAATVTMSWSGSAGSGTGNRWSTSAASIKAAVSDTTGPAVSSTTPANGATGVALNSAVAINWNENVDCTTVTTSTVTISPALTWNRTSCSGAQAVFTPAGQANSASYTVTATTGVKDTAGNAMAANYNFSYTTAALACIDADSDGYGANGAASCPNGTAIDCNDSNANINPGKTDTNCNGIDENCSGANDEGYSPTATSCGTGACAATGQNICQAGAIVNTCTPGTPAPSDTTCNGIDDNCNGTADEGYAPTATACGAGVCAASGQNICQSGSLVNTCTAGSPTGTDNNCNGLDENCDGTADNNYAPTATTCGAGVCAASGQNICQGGSVVNTCTAGNPTGTDNNCNGLDENCNGTADEAYMPTASTCGLGVCAATGQNICQGGSVINTCTAGSPTGTDNNCNAIDENCDGTADNNYVPTATTCGTGVCAASGQNICQGGSVVNTCTAGTPGVEGPAGNPTCSDSLDNDCDSQTDSADPACMVVGVCVDNDSDGYGSNGDATCPNGTAIDCDDNNPAVRPGAAEICDGKDTNCDGWKPATDVNNDNDNYPQCAGDCNDNNNTVYPGAAEICDGLDNNCDYSIPVNERDLDADGYRTCGVPADCNDNDRYINPGAQEWCSDNKDNNCNTQIDETPCICPDADSDGFTASYCGGTDCNDTDNTVYPGAPELCTDGKDNDCNGLQDCADPNAVNCPAITDVDGDGYDVAGICGAVDCDDNDNKVYPGAAEICDGKDSNCDGWKAPSDTDADGDGVPLCASDCDDTNPSRFPGNLEHALRNTCNDFIDNDCDNLTDLSDPNCNGSCQTAANPKQGPHFAALLNTDNTIHSDNTALSCGKCHAPDFQDPVRYECQRCHADPADTSDPRNGTLKAQYPLNAPYGFGSAPNVSTHTTWTLGDQGCVTCHNPHTQEQNNLFGTTYGKYVKEYICYDAKGIQQFVEFTANTGPGSFANGAPYNANICNTCHTTTNHQQNDGTAPGGQDHNNGTDCMQCHSHSGGFAPIGGTPAAPHNSAAFSNNCNYCHVSATDYTTPVPDSKCAQCHTAAGTLKASFPTAPNVLTHQAKACVGCHQLMTAPANLKLVKRNLSGIGGGANIVFTSLTGTGSFADGAPYGENVCNTCHTSTNHHQNDGTAPGGQDHNNGMDCMSCHSHSQGFTPTLPDPVAPHNTSAFLNNCSLCHISSSDFTSPVPDTKCQQCHSQAGVLKGTYPTAPNAASHQGRACIGCHEPMFGTANAAHVRTNLTAVGGGPNISFTAYTGAGSFADGPPYIENVCNTCHTMTNHQQNDGTAPGGQDHNNGADCTACHPHAQAFTPILPDPVAPHNTAAFLNDCSLCHVSSSDFTSTIPDTKCQQCHSPAGTLRGTFPTAPDALSHQNRACVGCHEPMFGTTNIAHVRTDLSAVGGGPNINFTAYTGIGSFADGAPYSENVCNTCHTLTNHQQNDGTAPGGQDHNNGLDCGLCHPHGGGFAPSVDVPPPHDGFSCTVCHVTSDTYVPNANIPNSACNTCHGDANSTTGPDVSTHNGSHYGSMSLNCVECHNPMSVQTNFRGLMNLKFIRDTIRGNSVAFEAYSGQYSFASDSNKPAGMLTQNYICNTCHTQTNHHQADGTAPGGQSHNDGTDCTLCHDHKDGLQPSGSCLGCHSTQQGNRAPVAGQFSANSHHVQGAPITDAKCYQCHWEANSDGSINNTYHGGWNVPGSAVDLVVYGSGARPTAYAAGTTAVVYTAGVTPPPPPAITVVNAWANLTTSGSGSSRTATFAASTGTNRIVLIGLAWENSTSCTPTITGNYGGQTITTINSARTSNNLQGQWMGYVLEAGIAAKTTNTITLSFTGCSPSQTPTMSAATYQGVSQTAPSSVIATGTTGTSYAWTGLPVVTSGYAMYNVSADTVASFTPPAGYTERYDAATTNFRMTGGDKAITSGSTESGTVTGNASSPRWALVAVSISPAAGSSPREVAKINQHCLGCHSAQNSAVQPFGDGKTPKQYAPDGLSIAERYSQTGTTTWGKYTTEANAAQKNITKAYSAHGNAANNKQGWSASTGIDGTIPDRTGSTNVACFDCHNSHGSSASGKTTSYTSATTNGGILKDTTSGLGGYTATYKPADFTGSATMVTHKAGAALCFNCHMTASASAAQPWGYSTFGATDKIVSYWEKPGWEGAVGVNPSGAQQRYPYKNSLDAIGSHFGASAALNTQAVYTIGGLCTPCHDPHGTSPNLGANQQYAVPMLKGSWLTSPYKEDVAPLVKNEPRGGGHDHSTQNIGSTMGYKIDQNTFRTGSASPFSVFNRYNVGTSGAGDRIMQTDQEFAGLCLQCHPKARIDPDTNNAWGTYDRIHDSVLGWAASTGNNANNAMHGYSCSKCHTPHSSCLPRLAITNCLDNNHRGRVATGGGAFPTHTYSGEKGGGQGRGPAGGGGWGEEPNQWSNNSGGNYLWGTAGTSSSHRPAYPTCHDNATAAGAWPNEFWNNVTEW